MEALPGRLEFLTLITRDMVRMAPEARFVFGDNLERRGLGGQAKEMRGEPNAIGIATKKAPSMADWAFFSDADEYAWGAVDADIEKVAAALDEGRTVYVPKDGIGTGLASLQRRAPQLHRHVIDRFRHLAGGEIPWN